MIFKKHLLLALSFEFLGGLKTPSRALGAVPLGSKPPNLTLSGDLGGKIDGTPWNSQELKDTVWILFYVDPDRRDDNLEFERALKNAGFDGHKFKSVGIINLAASWVPNGILVKALESKQKEYPTTTYVKDLRKKLVLSWGLKDDAYNTMILNTKGEIIYQTSGPIGPAETAKVLSIIRAQLAQSST